MKTITGIFLGLAIITGFVGFFPCVGWLNWFAVPLAGISALLGVIGLFSDREGEETQGTYFAALVAGTVMGGIFAFRCFLGGGLF